MAHKDPIHLARLVNALIASEAYFYIHIDKKVDSESFQELIQNEQVKFIKERCVVYWGGFSQIKARIALLKAMIGSGIEFDRVFILSGQDYPIYSNKRIAEYLEKYPQREIVSACKLNNGGRGVHKIKRYWFFDHAKWTRRFLNYLFYFLPFRKKVKAYFNNKYNTVYFGSEFMCLTYNCARYIYETYGREKDIQTYFKSSYAPVELVMHTIIYNSQYALNAVFMAENYQELYELSALEYFEYPKAVTIFTEDDFQKLIDSDKMFFRKAASTESLKLLDRIDTYRESESNLYASYKEN
jgi:hypothetical protein